MNIHVNRSKNERLQFNFFKKRDRSTLSDEDKVTILHYYKLDGPKWTQIGNIVDKKPRTMKSFITRFKRCKTINPKRERPFSICHEREISQFPSDCPT